MLEIATPGEVGWPVAVSGRPREASTAHQRRADMAGHNRDDRPSGRLSRDPGRSLGRARSRLGRCVGGLERGVSRSTGTSSNASQSRGGARHGLWGGAILPHRSRPALTSRASMRRRRLFRSLGTASRRGNSVSGTSSISLAGQLVRRRHRLQLIHLCCQYHRCAARGGGQPGPVRTSRSPCSGGRNSANQQTYSGRLDSFCQRRPEPVRWSRAARSGNP